jgi:signal transduction histidine kinase
MSLVVKHISLVASIGTFILSCLVLVGWVADVETLKRISLSQPFMMPVTAMTLFVASVSLGLVYKSQASLWAKYVGIVCASFMVFIGVMVACEYIFGVELRFETLLFKKDLDSLQTVYAGRPSPHTALNFILLGAALFALYMSKVSARRVAQVLGSAVVLIALLALVGYAYNASLLYRISIGIGMALHTAVAFILLGFGVLAASHGKIHPFILFRESVRGQIARMLLLPTIVLPIGLSGLITLGVQAGWYEPAYGMAFSAIMSVTVLSVLIWRYAKVLDAKGAAQIRERPVSVAHGILEREISTHLNQESRLESITSDKARLTQAGLLRQIINTQEEERHRMARELHDQMGQYLSAFILYLNLLKRDSPQTNSAKRILTKLEEIATQLSSETHRMVWELRPSALDEVGLSEALANYLEQWSKHTGIVVDYQSVGLDGCRIQAEVETAVYRVVQEALTNVLRHSKAHRVSLIVDTRNGQLNVVLEDDGKGFDVNGLLNGDVQHLGISGMQERIALVGGSMSIESACGVGTTIFARIPLSKENRENHEDIAYIHRRRPQNNAGRTQGSNKRTAGHEGRG